MANNKKFIMISCKEATTVLTEETPLSFIGKIRLKIHLAICPLCKSFENQMIKIKKGIRKNISRDLTIEDEKLSQHIEKKVLEEIKRKN